MPHPGACVPPDSPPIVVVDRRIKPDERKRLVAVFFVGEGEPLA